MTIALWWAVAITCAIAIVALFGMAHFHAIAVSWQRAFGKKHRESVIAQAETKQALIVLANTQHQLRVLRREVDDMLQNVSWEGVLPVDYFKHRLSLATATRRIASADALFPPEVGVWEIRMEPLVLRTAQHRADLTASEHVRKSIAMHMAAEFTEHLREDLAKRLEAQLKDDHEWLKANPPAADTTSTLRLTAS